MSNIKNLKLNKLVFYTLSTLIILAFATVVLMATKAEAQAQYQGGDFYDASVGAPDYVIYNRPLATTSGTTTTTKSSSAPVINTITPNSVNARTSTTVTIVGYNFNPNSMVRYNGADRFPTYVDSGHLVIQLSANDTAASGTKTIAVLNTGANSALSNSVNLTVRGGTVAGASTKSKQTARVTDYTVYNTDNGFYMDESYGDLTANAIFGSNSIMPTGLIQWVLFAILILIIVIIARRIFAGTHSTTKMKHA